MRYARQTVLAELGVEGQELLAQSRVLIVGVGGLGSPLALYLAAAGVGILGLVDADTVSLSNLARQILFQTNDQGSLKTTVAENRLRAVNSDCRVETFPQFLDSSNAESIAASFDVIVDATDNFESKFLLNDLAVKLSKPLVYGSILRWQGQASVFWAKEGPCYRCLYPEAPRDHVPNCAEAGVIGALAGVIGSLQALEVIKLLLCLKARSFSRDETLIGRLLLFDAKTMSSRTIQLAKDPDCRVCSKDPQNIILPSLSLRTCVLSDDDIAGNHARYRFIDVREENEWERGHIKDAVFWPLSLMRDQKIPEQESGISTVIYCQSGVRSRQAINLLAEAGWDLSSVQDLPGGFGVWVGPVTQGK